MINNNRRIFMKRKLLSTLLCFAMVSAVFTGCSSKAKPTDTQSTAQPTTAATQAAQSAGDKSSAAGGKIGVAMPTKTLQRWIKDGDNMKEKLEKAGYSVNLQYANDDAPTQVSQIENMIASDCKILVIAPIEADSLGTVLAQAKEKKIPVIAYDRLIKNSDAVTYYATFDNLMIGQMQGEYIEKKLDLANKKGPFNLEIFAGAPGDNNATFFYNGAMKVLDPYIKKGVLVVKSKCVTFEKVATEKWDAAQAQSRMENIISSFYADGSKIDAVLCSNDSTALGVETALTANYSKKNGWPIITGQDCDVANVKNMIAGKQSMSIYKDTRALAKQVVEMVGAIMKGGEAEVNDTTSYKNGVKTVPTYLCKPQYADINNYKDLLIKSKYYKESDLK
jgi:putative multiple sugar transport system substrate-binding protein